MIVQQIITGAVSTSRYDVISGRGDRREDAVAPPVGDHGTAANRNSSSVVSKPDNRKRKEKKEATVPGVKEATTETKAEKDGNSKQEINNSPQTILNVPQYAQTSCTETTVSDVTELDESAPGAESKR